VKVLWPNTNDVVFIVPEVPIWYTEFIFHVNTTNIQMRCVIRGATVLFNVTCSLWRSEQAC